MNKTMTEQEIKFLLEQKDMEESTGNSLAHGVCPTCSDDLYFDSEVQDQYSGRERVYGCATCTWQDYSWGVSASTDRHGLV